MNTHPRPALHKQVVSAYQERYGDAPEVIVHAPGRINLIGEHTDYNHGYVLPAAVAQGIWFAMGRNAGSDHDWYALDHDQQLRLPVGQSSHASDWAEYLQGAHRLLSDRHEALQATRCIFTSDLPVGAGLSSSSALTCGFLLGLNTLFGLQYARAELAWLAHLVEQDFVGLQGGIMDQHACLLAQAGHFLLLDCLDRSWSQVPYAEDAPHLFLINTGVRHTLTDTDYNTRAAECRRALEILRKEAGIKSLRQIMDIDLDDFERVLGTLLFQRLRFVKAENQRVLDAVSALRENDWHRLGGLLYESHMGLRDEYEVSCPELDFLVDLVLENNQVFGARMMGGGFGGCTINLAVTAPDAHLRAEISRAYFTQFGLKPDFIPVAPAEGAKVDMP